MIKHPSHTSIIATVLGTASRSLSDMVKAHIAECESCKDVFKSATVLYIPSNAAEISVSAATDERVGRSVRQIISEASAEKPRLIFLMNRFSMAASFAAAVVIIIFLLSHYIFFPANKPLGLDVSNISGNTVINNREIDSASRLNEHDLLRTGDKSFARVSLGNMFIVEVAQNTEFFLDSSREDVKHNNFIFSFNLRSGDINAKFNHDAVKLTYSFITPHARIDSIGTEFSMSVTPHETILKLREGTVRITALATGIIAMAHHGNEYVIMNTISEKTLLDSEEKTQNAERMTNAKKESPVTSGSKQKSSSANVDNSIREKIRDELRENSRDTVRDNREAKQDGGGVKKDREQRREGSRRER